MTEAPSRRRGGQLASAAVALLVLAGSAGLSGCAAAAPAAGPSAAGSPVAGSTAAGGAPPSDVPSAPSAQSPSAQTPTTAGAQAATAPPPARPAPAPVSLSIPDIGVQSTLLKLGLRKNRSLEVPPDGPGAPAGWYSGSPSPGETGPAVFLGHVNATGGGPGVFADLRGLRTGAGITVQRADGSTALFTVTRAAAYSKDNFPTLEVYGNTKGPELRLITCDGYDPATGLFDDNYVVFAKLKSTTAG